MSNTQPTKNTEKRLRHSIGVGSKWRWFKIAILLVIFSLVVNHLAASDNFIDSEPYKFPTIGFLMTIVLTIVVIIITEINFRFYKKKYFSKKVEIAKIFRFMGSTLGYITIMYVPANIIAELIIGGRIHFYYILIGLLITLLVCFILISLSYAQDLYQLYRLSVKEAEITIESGAKITKLTYENIACFYSENKIVYTLQKDGTIINTDFTLNELEEKINDQMFFRANRKMIIHKDAVGQVEKIENGKLRIQLKAFNQSKVISEINISRYKRKAFMDWFQ